VNECAHFKHFSGRCLHNSSGRSLVFEKDIRYVIMEVAYLSGGYFHSVGMVAEVE
jgi:hypothetical protein